MGTLYARKLTAPATIERQPPAPGYIGEVPPCTANSGDVALYTDADCTRFVALIPAHYSTCPTRRNRWVTINCARHRLEWAE